MKQLHNLFIILFTLSFGLYGCYLDNTDEASDARQLNDQQIQDYIVANGLNATGTGTGLFYQVTTANPNGQRIQKGDSVIYHYVAKLISGTIVDSTSTFRNRPDKIITDTRATLAGLEEALYQLHEGEEATVLIPSYLGLGQASTSTIPPYSVIIYEIKILDVKSEEEMIEAYISDKELSVTQILDSNVRFIRLNEGVPNTKPVKDLTYRVSYRGTLLNDIEFDAGLDSSFEIKIGTSGVVFGFEAGIKAMNQADSAIIIIPSKAGYGKAGSGANIPPYASLVFELRLVKTDKQQFIEYITPFAWTDTVSTTSGIIHRREIQGSGNKPANNARVEVEFTGLLLDGTTFGSSLKDTFNLEKSTFENSFINSSNTARTITGLREGLQLMQIGETRRFMIPSNLAFGATSFGIVRRRTPVIFVVKLLRII